MRQGYLELQKFDANVPVNNGDLLNVTFYDNLTVAFNITRSANVEGAGIYEREDGRRFVCLYVWGDTSAEERLYLLPEVPGPDEAESLRAVPLSGRRPADVVFLY